MFGILLMIILIVGFIGILWVSYIYDNNRSNFNGVHGFIAVLCALMVATGILGGIIYLSTIDTYTSPNNYYITLSEKKIITEELETYEEEIHSVLSGDVTIIDFNKQEKIIELNSRIQQYNYKINQHRKFKESFWFSKLYNKNIADLELLPLIFNVIEE